MSGTPSGCFSNEGCFLYSRYRNLHYPQDLDLRPGHDASTHPDTLTTLSIREEPLFSRFLPPDQVVAQQSMKNPRTLSSSGCRGLK